MKISPPTGNQLAMAVCSRYDGHQSLLLALYVTMLQHELQITASISWFTEAHQVSDGAWHSWCSCWGFPSQVKRSSSIDDGSKISIISNLKFSNFKCIPNLSKYYNIDRNSHSHQKAIKLKLRRQRPRSFACWRRAHARSSVTTPAWPLDKNGVRYCTVHPSHWLLIWKQIMTIGCWRGSIGFHWCCMMLYDVVWKKRSLVFRDSPFSDGHAFPGTSHDMPEPQTKLREGAS